LLKYASLRDRFVSITLAGKNVPFFLISIFGFSFIFCFWQVQDQTKKRRQRGRVQRTRTVEAHGQRKQGTEGGGKEAIAHERDTQETKRERKERSEEGQRPQRIGEGAAESARKTR
jgi:hypothetical protein